MSTIHKLNLGCGNDYKIGWINLDRSYIVNPDLVWNFESEPLPFETDMFDEVLAQNSLTQIARSDDFMRVMNDLWRITKPEGVISIRVPRADHICAFQDPMDCRWFTPESFSYMQHEHRRYKEYGKHYGFKPFKVQLVEDNGAQMLFQLTPVK